MKYANNNHYTIKVNNIRKKNNWDFFFWEAKAEAKATAGFDYNKQVTKQLYKFNEKRGVKEGYCLMYLGWLQSYLAEPPLQASGSGGDAPAAPGPIL